MPLVSFSVFNPNPHTSSDIDEEHSDEDQEEDRPFRPDSQSGYDRIRAERNRVLQRSGMNVVTSGHDGEAMRKEHRDKRQEEQDVTSATEACVEHHARRAGKQVRQQVGEHYGRSGSLLGHLSHSNVGDLRPHEPKERRRLIDPFQPSHPQPWVTHHGDAHP